MNFRIQVRTVALAVMAVNLAFAIPASAQVYNGAGSQGSAKPVFIPKQGASQDQVYNPGTSTAEPSSSGKNHTTQEEYKRMNDKVAQDNKRVLDETNAKLQAQFAEDAKRDAQWAAEKEAMLAKAKQESGGSGSGSAASGGKAGAAPVDPNAGKTRVFVNAPKEKEDKPVRLFNVQ